MKKYMIIAKNDYNEEIFYTDIKAEAKEALDRMWDKYICVKAFCYSYADEKYYDITGLNEQSKWSVVVYNSSEEFRYCKPLVYDKTEHFTNEAEALKYMICNERAGRKCRLYKNERRCWDV